MVKSICRKTSAAFVLALALGAVVASTAAASETLSFVPHSGKFPVKKVTVKGNNMFFEEEGTGYHCASGITGEGEITGSKTAWLKLHLTECLAEGQEFTSPGAKPGEIVTEKLPVQLVYVSREHHEAALALNYQPPAEKLKMFATWEPRFLHEECGIRGPVLAPVSPVNSSVLSHSLTLALSKSGIQQPSAYETEAGSKYLAAPQMNILCGTGYSEGGISTSNKLEISTSTTEGTVEIKA
jgi:hypothetical protein